MKGVWVEVHGYELWTYQSLAAWPFVVVFAVKKDKTPLQEHQIVEAEGRGIFHFTFLPY